MNTTIYNGIVGKCAQPKTTEYFWNNARQNDGTGVSDDTWTAVEARDGDVERGWQNVASLLYGLEYVVNLDGGPYSVDDVGVGIRWSIASGENNPDTFNGDAFGAPMLVLAHSALFMGSTLTRTDFMSSAYDENQPVPTAHKRLWFPIPIDISAFLSTAGQGDTGSITPGNLSLYAQMELGSRSATYYASLYWDWTVFA